MLQFYFLSILLNLTVGFIFVFSGHQEAPAEGDASAPGDEDGGENPGGMRSAAISFLGDKTLRLVVGILSLLTGLMKLLSPIQYDIAVVGDLVPALAGLASGAVLLLDWYQERSDVGISLPEALQGVYTGGRKYLGIFCIIAAALHFIFPLVLFL